MPRPRSLRLRRRGTAGVCMVGARDFPPRLSCNLAWGSTRRPELKWAAILWLFFTVVIIYGVTLVFGILSLVPPEGMTGDHPVLLLNEETTRNAWLIAAGCFMAGLFSLMPFEKQFTTRLARHFPIDPDSTIHMLAMCVVLAATLIPLVPLIVTGIPPYLSPFFQTGVETGAIAPAAGVGLYSLFWMVVLSLVAVGFWITRDRTGVLGRLGLTRPSLNECGIAIGTGLALVVLFILVEMGISSLWTMLGWPVTDTAGFTVLIAHALTPAGILLLAVSAGVGEEIAFRGVLQPRFGIIIPSLLFASLHSFQYGWDGLISVFLLGIVFALIRRRYSTTVSAITHTVYDLVLLAALMVGIAL
ncbi:MAG TPA: CPBP family intramembrane metalloprotease [Methanoculleus sp.]|nr:CPBP family intramembrane metalloprotease [Methanoculleus sp.]